jgi:hypothetical protein
MNLPIDSHTAPRPWKQRTNRTVRSCHSQIIPKHEQVSPRTPGFPGTSLPPSDYVFLKSTVINEIYGAGKLGKVIPPAVRDIGETAPPLANSSSRIAQSSKLKAPASPRPCPHTQATPEEATNPPPTPNRSSEPSGDQTSESPENH